MFIDNNLVLDYANAVTTSGASANYIDTLAAGDALTPGAQVEFLINTAFTSSGALSITFDIQTDTTSTFGAATTLISSGAIAKASLTAGAVPLRAVLPVGMKRYIRAYYTATAVVGGGKADCRIVLDAAKTIDKVL